MAPKRRHLLVAIGGTLALAGCLSDDDDDVADDTDDDVVDDDDDEVGDGDTDDDEMVGDEDDEDDGVGDEGTGDEEDATVRVTSHDEYGDILVGPEGLSLYMFDSDEQGADESTCYGECEDNWPPLVVDDEPVAGDGVEAELTTFERDDGEMQMAANGWPLYYWVADEAEGDVSGQGVNDVWWLMTPDGEPIRDGEEEEEDDTGNGAGGY